MLDKDVERGINQQINAELYSAYLYYSMAAYFEALSFVKDNPEKATEIVQGKYIQQELELIRENMDKFIWHDLEAQRKVMSEKGIFGQAEYVVRILREDMNKIPEKPDFLKWVNLDILPFED